jgi:hypothetical protein
MVAAKGQRISVFSWQQQPLARKTCSVVVGRRG